MPRKLRPELDTLGPVHRETPPTLDELWAVLRDALGKKQMPNAFGAWGPSEVPRSNIFAVVLLLLGAYVLSGFYVVQPPERAVVFQFGKHLQTVEPGLHWLARGIQSKKIINVTEVHTDEHGGYMLTEDQNIVRVELAVQYRITHIEDFLFCVAEPIKSVGEVVDSAIRQVIGQSRLEDILSGGRQRIRDDIAALVTQIIAQYRSGIELVDVTFQAAMPPEEVTAAFNDAIKAQEDEQRSINQAMAYEQRVVPAAEGKARRILEDAKAHAAKVEQLAVGEVSRFLALLPHYQADKAVMQKRLYLETIERIYSRIPKLIVPNNLNLLYWGDGQKSTALPALKAGQGET